MASGAERPHIGVIGASDATQEELEHARAVGQALAEAGAILVCGGLGGVMQAACEGARSRGGTTVGILPGSERSSANPYVDVAIPTGLGELRNGLIVRASDSLIAIGEGWGTLSEIALAVRTCRPVLCLASWELPTRDGDRLERVEGPLQAVDRALSLARANPA